MVKIFIHLIFLILHGFTPLAKLLMVKFYQTMTIWVLSFLQHNDWILTRLRQQKTFHNILYINIFLHCIINIILIYYNIGSSLLATDTTTDCQWFYIKNDCKLIFALANQILFDCVLEWEGNDLWHIIIWVLYNHNYMKMLNP